MGSKSTCVNCEKPRKIAKSCEKSRKIGIFSITKTPDFNNFLISRDFHNFSKFFAVFRNFSQLFAIFHNFSQFFAIFRNFSQFFTVFRNSRNFRNFSQLFILSQLRLSREYKFIVLRLPSTLRKLNCVSCEYFLSQSQFRKIAIFHSPFYNPLLDGYVSPASGTLSEYFTPSSAP